MVDEVLDRDARRKLNESAKMIAMEVLQTDNTAAHAKDTVRLFSGWWPKLELMPRVAD
jgi:hypothetical protein